MIVIELIGFTLDMIGKILVGISVILVHTRVMRERKIDKLVIKAMGREKVLAISGIVLIILGYLLQLPTKV
ncbi:MAG: hypothetical protein HY361_00920 [Candidatus Aenigmarchaeota archaeon]|nr:hypothetical protein [Candidatus Aenigmarchaeota archaeon]